MSRCKAASPIRGGWALGVVRAHPARGEPAEPRSATPIFRWVPGGGVAARTTGDPSRSWVPLRWAFFSSLLRESATRGLVVPGGLGTAKDLALFQEDLDGGFGPKAGNIILAFCLVLLLEDLLPDHIPDVS